MTKILETPDVFNHECNSLFTMENEDVYVFHESERIWAYTKATIAVISIILLSLTSYAYIISPDIRTVHGKCSILHIFALIGFYVFHILMQLLKESVTRNVCVVIDVMWMYFALMSYFWLQILSFDAWRSFRRLGLHRQSISRFKYYFAYASGIPTLILIFALWFEFSDLIPKKLSLYCIRKYWTVTFFMVPAFFILLSNLYFFISTSMRIREIDRKAHKNEDDDNKRREKQRFKTYLRLFIITGGAWCFSIISTIILFIWNKLEPLDQKTANHVSSVIVSLSNLQSLGIFITCVCLTHLRHVLLQRFCPSKFQTVPQTFSDAQPTQHEAAL